MNLCRKDKGFAQGRLVATSAPIAKKLLTMPKDEQKRMEIEFNIAYFIATEHLSFAKYPCICSLEARHGVNLGTNYRNATSCSDFVRFLSMSKKEELSALLSQANLFSLLMDGSTDAANIDNEIFLVVWCDTDSEIGHICTKTSFLTVDQPPQATAEGLMASLEHSLKCLGVEYLDCTPCSRLVGIGTYGASANIAAGGLKGLVK